MRNPFFDFCLAKINEKRIKTAVHRRRRDKKPAVWQVFLLHLIMLMRMDGERNPTAEGEMNEDACTAQKQESDKQINLSTECIKYPHQRRAFRGRKEEHIVLVKVEVDKADHEHNREEQAQDMVEAAQIGSMASGQNLCQRHVD